MAGWKTKNGVCASYELLERASYVYHLLVSLRKTPKRKKPQILAHHHGAHGALVPWLCDKGRADTA